MEENIPLDPVRNEEQSCGLVFDSPDNKIAQGYLRASTAVGPNTLYVRQDTD